MAPWISRRSWRRYAKGLTHEELTGWPGLSARYLGGMERAGVSATVTVLGRVADALTVMHTRTQCA